MGDALSFVRNIFAASEMQTMRSQVENLTKENEQLKTKVSTLETDKTVLEKKIVKMEEVAAAAKDSEKKDESPASPKQIDEGDVSNETPQESVSAEESTTSPTKEASSDVPTAETTESRNEVVPVEETKIAEDVTEPPTPVATKDSEEPTNSSDAMRRMLLHPNKSRLIMQQRKNRFISSICFSHQN